MAPGKATGLPAASRSMTSAIPRRTTGSANIASGTSVSADVCVHDVQFPYRRHATLPLGLERARFWCRPHRSIEEQESQMRAL